MINLLLGPYGHGKSSEIINRIKADYENNIRSYLIVPEQQTLIAERQLASTLPSPAQRFTEATNFTRLANSVFRKTGGLKYNYVTKSGQNLIMYQALCNCQGSLKHFVIEKGHERRFISLFLHAIKELKTYGYSPKEFEAIISQLDSKNEHLKARLDDLIIIWTAYEGLFGKTYSDPYDDILLLNKKLGECEFFKDCNVYIDSFYDFTSSQLSVLDRIISQAKNVTIALDCPKNAAVEDTQYAKIAKTKNHIISRYKERVKITDFTCDYQHKSKELEYVCKNLWSFDAEPINTSKDVRLLIAGDEFQECEYVCARIKRLIQKGERYGSIGIITRNPSTYQGIIDFCLKKYDIPHYMSISSRLTTKPVIKMVFSAIRAVSEMKAEDIISYIKCGYTDVSDEDIYLLENYMHRWSIRGEKFKKDDYWTANPDGFVEKPKKYQLDNLKRIQKARELILKKLEILERVFDGKHTVKECCSGVYEFLSEYKVRDKIQSEINAMAQKNKDAQELSQVWGLLVKSLELIADICTNAICTEDTFLSLLSYAMMDVKIGSIPSGIDNVIVADASLVRANDLKHVFILGANEGEFPAIVQDDSFFSDRDKTVLETLSCILSDKTDTRLDDEFLFFANSVAAASHTVTIISLKTGLNGEKKEPCVGFSRILSLLKGARVEDISLMDSLGKIYTREMAQELYYSSTKEAQAAISQVASIEGEEISFTNCQDKLDSNTVKLAFGKSPHLSKSRLETFKNCHLSFYCNYILKLNHSEKIRFASNDVGELIHHVFENFLRDNSGVSYPDKEIWNKVSSLVDDYTISICGRYALSNKMKHFFTRLKSTICVFVKALLEEKKASKLTPYSFELDICGDGNGTPLPTRLPINKDFSFTVSGIADRVDVLRSGDSAYIKVIDYKSGTHVFNKEDLEEGYDQQMLIYLYALCNMTPCEFKDKLLNFNGDGTPAKELLPAGIIYLTYEIDQTKVDKEVDLDSPDAVVLEEAEMTKKIKRSGMELKDDRVLSGDKKYRLSEKSQVEMDEFMHLFDLVKANIMAVGNDMLSGDATAMPVTDKGACNFCNYGAVCRRRVKSERFN